MPITINIEDTNPVTLHVEPDDLFEINFPRATSVDFHNQTDRPIFISEKNDFNKYENDKLGKYLTINSDNGYNDYIFYTGGKKTLYVKCHEQAKGFISIMKKEW